MSTSKAKTVLGAFQTLEGAALAADRLEAAEVPRNGISVMMSEDARGTLATLDRKTKAPEGTAIGGAAGGALGAIVAGLTTVASVTLLGVGLLAAGPLVAALGGAGAGAVAGGVVGGLIGLGVNENEAKRHDDVLREGGVIVAVEVSSDAAAAKAREVLRGAGALEVETEDGRPVTL